MLDYPKKKCAHLTFSFFNKEETLAIFQINIVGIFWGWGGAGDGELTNVCIKRYHSTHIIRKLEKGKL